MHVALQRIMEVDPEPFLKFATVRKESMLLTYKKLMQGESEGQNPPVVMSPSDITVTVRASLVGNVMLLYDVESAPASTYPSRAILLERCVAQLEDPMPVLPYPFVITQYDRKYYFSCFAEEDRADWEQIFEKQLRNKYSRLRRLQEPGFQVNTLPKVSVDAEDGKWQCPMSGLEVEHSNLLFARLVCRPFKVPETNPAVMLCEHMAEPKATLTVPVQLLDCTAKFWSFLLDHMRSLHYLPKDLEARKQVHVQALGACLAKLDDNIEFMNAFHGYPFKSSISKDSTELAFLPTNLHVQSVRCSDKRKAVDYFTCGAFTAYSEGYEQGGLRAMASRLSENTIPSGSFECDLKKVASRLRAMSATEAALRSLRLQLLDAFQEPGLGAALACCRQLVTTAIKLHGSVLGQLSHSGDKLDALTEQLSSWFDQWSTADGIEARTGVRVQSLQAHRDDFDAELASLHTKVENISQCNEAQGSNSEAEMIVGLHHSAEAVLVRLESLHLTLVHCYIVGMVNCLATAETVHTFYKLLCRYAIVLSQALTSVVAVLLNVLWMTDDEQFLLKTSLWSHSGALVSVHSFLSCLLSERCMLEDIVDMTSLLRSRCKFRLVRMFSLSKSCSPVVEGDLGAIKVTLPVPSERWDILPQSLRDGEWFQVHVILWNVGVNHDQSLAIKIQVASLENEINQGAGVLLERYCLSARRQERQFDEEEIKEALGELRRLNVPNQWKNVALTHQAMRLCRMIGGDVVICCKSGKDRTSMAVTYDEALFVQHLYSLSQDATAVLLESLRREGTRLENAYKNLGARRYAFKRGQLAFVPPCYRPPEGLYGSLLT
uniref:PH domain-containing protein n=1 Tax=Trichuris muris TaxID=70415 RepID=A0A5S6QHL0_TRIMR